ncbi:MAG: molybdopterin-dependent oxidoreductase, partial [Chloroflexota bacterium]
MSKRRWTRRQFLQVAGATAAAAIGGRLVSGGEKLATAKEEVPRLIPTVCGICDARCGVVAYVREGKLLKLEGNYRHSHSLGRICPRGSAGVKLLYDPDRLKCPLKRGADGRFERITWEQAFKEIAERLQAIKEHYGPRGLAWLRHHPFTVLYPSEEASLSSPLYPDLADAWDRQFMRTFGSPNLFSHISLGRAARNAAAFYTVGALPVFDLENSRYILLFGRNHAEGMFVADTRALLTAKSRGAHIVAVDPRLTNTAAQAHEWIPIKPGTDGAMLLAMMNVIVEEKLYDTDFVGRHTTGFEQLKELLADKTPGWASHLTDVPADTIRRIAREFALARPTCGVDPGWHGAWGSFYSNSFQTARA